MLLLNCQQSLFSKQWHHANGYVINWHFDTVPSLLNKSNNEIVDLKSGRSFHRLCLL